MVKMIIDIPENISKYLKIQKEIKGHKDIKQTVISILDEKLSTDKLLVTLIQHPKGRGF